MALNIVSNFAANVAQRQLASANDAATESVAKLSAGKRVLAAKDDAAASAISARLSAEINGLKQANVNAGQASSLLQIADGAFSNTQDILTRMKSLAVQAGSDQLSDTERSFLDQEFQALSSEIERIAQDTEFNGTKLVNGDVDGNVNLNTGGTAMVTFATTGGGTGTVTQASLAQAGLQAVDAMGVQLATSNAEVANATVGPVQTGTLNFNTGNGTFMLSGVNVMTTGGASTTANFTGTLVDASGSAITGTPALTMDAQVQLMGSATNVAGTITVSIGTAFAPTTTGAVASNVILSGEETSEFNFKVGTGTNASEDEISVSIGSITQSALGIDGQSIDSKANADAASDALSQAIDTLQEKRSNVGASQNRLDFAANNVQVSVENQEAARSELEDLNVASEITQFTSQQLLVQAGTSVLAQANQLPQNLLSLFQ
ncbi:flagellin [Ferruginivarius sediminum]|uniref:Flagellin n=1 Tax=Ferruginivarius sediminum TaxID=2661937 RepID=A0A369THQ2_9PROT|nr:flagellin [Ferruginivarius sediminum]RDD63647.1 flagellin [Ferruginivarius sediminum]